MLTLKRLFKYICIYVGPNFLDLLYKRISQIFTFTKWKTFQQFNCTHHKLSLFFFFHYLSAYLVIILPFFFFFNHITKCSKPTFSLIFSFLFWLCWLYVVRHVARQIIKAMVRVASDLTFTYEQLLWKDCCIGPAKCLCFNQANGRRSFYSKQWLQFWATGKKRKKKNSK